jgi:hypothetical protein
MTSGYLIWRTAEPLIAHPSICSHEALEAVMVAKCGFAPNQILQRLSDVQVSKLNSLVFQANLLDLSSLLQQLSLHLPRFPLPNALGGATIMAEAERLANRLSSLQEVHRACIPTISCQAVSARDLVFCTVPEEAARQILESYHYLLSFREQSYHLGLKLAETDCWPIAMCSLSPFDLKNTAELLLHHGYRGDETLVLSRVYAFPGAPKNSISFLLGRVRSWLLTNMPSISLLVTYLNPNIGFSGVTYRADNWSLLGFEEGTRYAYYRENYTTDRVLYSRFGPNFERGDSNVTFSKVHLKPLRLFYRSVSRPTPDALGRSPVFSRWAPGR